MNAGKVNGTTYELISARENGNKARPVIVLIHGLGLSRSIWRRHIEDLAQHHSVLIYDLYGHGESDALSTSGSLKIFSGQLKQLLDALRITHCVLVGFSLGGMINRRFMIDYPSSNCSLVILNSPHQRDPEAQHKVELRAEETSAGGPAATIDATMERWFTPEFRKDYQELIEPIREGVLSNRFADYVECRKVLAYGVTELICPEPPIIARTLVVTCENDSGSTPAMTHAIASEIPGAQSLIIPKLQHMGLVERPELFTQAVLRFCG